MKTGTPALSVSDAVRGGGQVNSMRLLLVAGIGFSLLAHPCLVRADSVDGPYTYVVSNGMATITAFSNAYAGPLVITNMLGGVPVARIGTWPLPPVPT